MRKKLLPVIRKVINLTFSYTLKDNFNIEYNIHFRFFYDFFVFFGPNFLLKKSKYLKFSMYVEAGALLITSTGINCVIKYKKKKIQV